MESTAITSATTPLAFLRSPLGIATLMIVSTMSGGWLRDRLSTETRDTGSTVRIEELAKRVDQIQAAQAGALSANTFNEFRIAQDKRLDDLRTDMRDLLAEVNSQERLTRLGLIK